MSTEIENLVFQTLDIRKKPKIGTVPDTNFVLGGIEKILLERRKYRNIASYYQISDRQEQETIFVENLFCSLKSLFGKKEIQIADVGCGTGADIELYSGEQSLYYALSARRNFNLKSYIPLDIDGKAVNVTLRKLAEQNIIPAYPDTQRAINDFCKKYGFVGDAYYSNLENSLKLQGLPTKFDVIVAGHISLWN